MPIRLQRLERVFPFYPVYFVTLCTERRKRILANDEVHEAFLEFARRSIEYGVSPGRYVLMPDHIHVLVGFSLGSISLSLWVKSLRNRLSSILRRSGHPSPHWQKDFFDHLIRSDQSYFEKYEYIRTNPVAAGLVERPEDWAFQGEVFLLERV
jgi:REP element-mobilizing transposase RayT